MSDISNNARRDDFEQVRSKISDVSNIDSTKDDI